MAELNRMTKAEIDQVVSGYPVASEFIDARNLVVSFVYNRGADHCELNGWITISWSQYPKILVGMDNRCLWFSLSTRRGGIHYTPNIPFTRVTTFDALKQEIRAVLLTAGTGFNDILTLLEMDDDT
jgi:hypothetical protein